MPRKKNVKRAYSPEELYRKKCPEMAFDGVWKEVFGRPAPIGMWVIWGNSGNGKSSFTMQLAKYLCRFGKVFYNSVEEDVRNTFINNVRRNKMEEVNKQFKTGNLTLDELEERMKSSRKEDIYIIDSFQAMRFTHRGKMDYEAFCSRHPDKLIIFVSRAQGNLPQKQPAIDCMYDADVKIWVEGFQAVCKGRFETNPGKSYIIWEDRAVKYGNINPLKKTQNEEQ